MRKTYFVLMFLLGIVAVAAAIPGMPLMIALYTLFIGYPVMIVCINGFFYGLFFAPGILRETRSAWLISATLAVVFAMGPFAVSKIWVSGLQPADVAPDMPLAEQVKVLDVVLPQKKVDRLGTFGYIGNSCGQLCVHVLETGQVAAVRVIWAGSDYDIAKVHLWSHEENAVIVGQAKAGDVTLDLSDWASRSFYESNRDRSWSIKYDLEKTWAVAAPAYERDEAQALYLHTAVNYCGFFPITILLPDIRGLGSTVPSAGYRMFRVESQWSNAISISQVFADLGFSIPYR